MRTKAAVEDASIDRAASNRALLTCTLGWSILEKFVGFNGPGRNSCRYYLQKDVCKFLFRSDNFIPSRKETKVSPMRIISRW